MRVFVSVPISDEVKHSLVEGLGAVRDCWRHVKWVSPENFHFTLKFLGDLEAETAEKVRERLRTAFAGTKAFDVHLKGFGGFPSLHNPRILWCGVNAGQEKLCALAHQAAHALDPLGLPKEAREFKPHLTVGRIRAGRQMKGALVPDSFVKKYFGCFEVKEVCLMRSELNPDGAVYSVLEKYQMG